MILPFYNDSTLGKSTYLTICWEYWILLINCDENLAVGKLYGKTLEYTGYCWWFVMKIFVVGTYLGKKKKFSNICCWRFDRRKINRKILNFTVLFETEYLYFYFQIVIIYLFSLLFVIEKFMANFLNFIFFFLCEIDRSYVFTIVLFRNLQSLFIIFHFRKILGKFVENFQVVLVIHKFTWIFEIDIVFYWSLLKILLKKLTLKNFC